MNWLRLLPDLAGSSHFDPGNHVPPSSLLLPCALDSRRPRRVEEQIHTVAAQLSLPS